jgi:hypothetical protein
VLKGATGLVYEPFKGARTRGARGFAVGVGKGLAGAALRPTAGLLKLADSWAGAWVLLTHGLTGEGADGAAGLSGKISRVRPPRMLHDGAPHQATSHGPSRFPSPTALISSHAPSLPLSSLPPSRAPSGRRRAKRVHAHTRTRTLRGPPRLRASHRAVA